jgi:hypothetical protein
MTIEANYQDMEMIPVICIGMILAFPGCIMAGLHLTCNALVPRKR